ncbi:MAG: Fe-S cluster assembly protein SufD [Thalassobaculaceae bacterium]
MTAAPDSAARFAADLAAALPAKKAEYWRYSRLAALRDGEFQPAANDGAAVVSAAADGTVLTFVDGFFRPDLSTAGIAGVTVDHTLPSVTLPARGDGFGALNQKWATPVHLAIDAAADPASVLRLRHLTSAGGQASHPRLHVSVAAGAAACLVEEYHGPADAYFVNGMTTLDLAAGGRLKLYKHQGEGAQAVHLARTTAHLGAAAALSYFVLQTGAAVARNEVTVTLAGAEATADLGGVYLARGRQQIDNTVLVDHAVADGTSAQVFRGVLDDQAHGIFQGKIAVRRDAQRSEGEQLSRALLLSRRAEVSTKPELEILADDVQCSHGATIGELDESQIFYLRARGISLAMARALLINAFVTETLDTIDVPAVKDAFGATVGDWLATAEGAAA